MKFQLYSSTRSGFASLILLGLHFHCGACIGAETAENDESPVRVENVKERIKTLRSGPRQLADKSDNEDVTKMYIQARTLIQQGHSAAAVPLLEKCHQLDPTFLSGLTHLGIALQTLGRMPESIDAFKKVVEMAPNRASYWSNLANAYLIEQNFDLAADAFKHSLDLDPSLSQTHEAYGFVLTKLGKDKLAKEQLLEAVKIDPTAANAWHLLGGVNLRLNQSKEARDAYTEYLRLNPKAKDAHEVAATLKRLGKVSSKSADSDAEKAKVEIENKDRKVDTEDKDNKANSPKAPESQNP